MGPMDVYQTFAINGTQSGGMMNKTPQTPAPFTEPAARLERRSVKGGAGRSQKAIPH